MAAIEYTYSGPVQQCLACRAILTDPVVNTWTEPRPYGEGDVYETLGTLTCPECGSDDLDDYREPEPEEIDDEN